MRRRTIDPVWIANSVVRCLRARGVRAWRDKTFPHSGHVWVHIHGVRYSLAVNMCREVVVWRCRRCADPGCPLTWHLDGAYEEVRYRRWHALARFLEVDSGRK